MWRKSFNPYFTGLPILIHDVAEKRISNLHGFNPYFTGLPILISCSQRGRW